MIEYQKKTITLLCALSITSLTMAQITVFSSDIIFPKGNNTALFKITDTDTLGSVPQGLSSTLFDYSGIVTTDSSYLNYITSDGLRNYKRSFVRLQMCTLKK